MCPSHPVAREIVAPASAALGEIRGRCGAVFILADGTLDRRRLREKVFADAGARRELEGITHPRIRARLLEWRDAQKAAYGVLDVPILIVHVSGGEAVEQIRWAHARGFNIYAETCPQYPFLTADSLGAEGYHGAKCVCSPPPSDRANQQRIWD